MRTIFIHAKSNLPISLPLDSVAKLPKPIGVATNIQYLHRLDDVVKQVKGVKAGQVLGCRVEGPISVAKKVQSFLFIGSGKFHPIGIALSTGKPVWCFDPATKSFERISDDDIKRFEDHRRGALLKFLHAKTVGLLVSTKAGQVQMRLALQFRQACKDKEVFIFAFETLSKEYLDNFTFIDSWVNTSCPRLPETDNPGMVNLIDVLSACPKYKIACKPLKIMQGLPLAQPKKSCKPKKVQ